MSKFKTGNQKFSVDPKPPCCLPLTVSVKNLSEKRLLSWLKWPKSIDWRRRLQGRGWKCNAEAAWLAAEKAARKAVKKGKKCVIEELGIDVGAKGPKPKKRVKMIEGG